MGFLSDLASQLASQFYLGENANHSLDAVIDGQNVKYGELGDFASQFDQSAERKYVEEGYLRTDPFTSDPKQFEILMQQPNATVFVKKRMFSSIAENYRPDYMDADEKLYYKAIKVLFSNKCAQINALEMLSKIQSVTSGGGSISETLIPIIISLSDTISGQLSGNDLFLGFAASAFGGSDASKLINITDQLRKLYSFNTTSNTTTWLTDSSNLFQSQFGQGTGTIEITNFTNISTNVSVDGIHNAGTFSLSIVDPYESMLITEWDIEKAIADATNMFVNSNVFQLIGESGGDQIISDKQARLNQIRAARGASPITLKINPYTLLGKRVTAIFDRIGTELIFSYDSTGGTGIPGLGGITGGGVNVSEDYLINGVIAGVDGLDTQPSNIGIGDTGIRQLIPDTELAVFQALVTAVYSKIQLEGNSQSTFQLTNKATNYARRKMRFNFSGKLIIQPMDTVHIYMGSKSVFDTKILGGLNTSFNGFGALQTINTLVSSIQNIGSLLNPSASLDIQSEKAAYVGQDFPDFLWMLLRSQFVGENEGTHVFAGVVDSASDTWNEGKFTVSVSGKDNTVYFDQGKVNFKPGVDVFNGAIFDPLTPYKTNFDTISSNAKADTPQFLDENVSILGTSLDKTGLLKAKSGPTAGQKLCSDHFLSEIIVDKSTGISSKVLYAPDGLVYKWKEGIGVFVQFGESSTLNDANKVGNPSISNEPFAGQDIMNVISLLITGQPYNYSTFWRASANYYGSGRNPQSQQDASNSYIQSLQNDLKANNALWGNFIPFKNLVIDEQSFALAQQAQFRVVQRNKDLDAKIQKLQDLNQAATAFTAGGVFGTTTIFSSQFDAVKAQLANLQSSINSSIQQISQEDASFNAASAAAGADATYDYSDFVGSSSTSTTNPNVKRELRRKINYLTRRMSYNVRANEDKNLFIVDDTYDKDYDILAYNQSLTNGIPLYNNDFLSTREKISSTADLLNLEVFADTQGHIRVRVPQYNRMPSSVFYRMMYLKQAYGIQIFPQFLDDLFSTQIDSLRKRVEGLEDLIRLDCAVVLNTTAGGLGADADAVDFVTTGGAAANTGAQFNFLSDINGSIIDLNQILHVSNPDDPSLLQSANAQIQSFIDTTNLSGQATSTKTVFANSTRYAAIITQLKAQAQDANGYSSSNIPAFQANTYVDQLITRVQTKLGIKITKKDFIINNAATGNEVVTPINQVVDIFKITTELQKTLQERQLVIRSLYSTLKNSADYRFLDVSSLTAVNQIMAPSTYGNSQIPEVFEHMIEDESYDDYGPGSSSRYIIKRSQIRNIQITETPPDYTYVEVQGIFDKFANAVPQELNSFPNNGNGLVTAAAIDYDAWRNYGFKNQTSIKVPFLNDPNSQCAPYASMILSRARKNVLRGSVTISGNEYMQPGEVVYLQDRAKLFYINAVRHNFGFAGTFTTTLDLTYGHSPGEYIPTTMDVIGKMIYNNRDAGQVTVQRQSSTANETALGVIQMDPNTASSLLSTGNAAQNSYANFNQQTLNNILFTAANIINSNNTDGNNVTANIELRCYFDDQTNTTADLLNFADAAMGILTTTASPSGTTSISGSQFANQAFPKDNVKVIPINLDDTNDHRSPSQQAIDAARNQVASSSISISIPTGSSDTTTPPPANAKLRAALFGYIVDCWVTFTVAPITGT